MTRSANAAGLRVSIAGPALMATGGHALNDSSAVAASRAAISGFEPLSLKLLFRCPVSPAAPLFDEAKCAAAGDAEAADDAKNEGEDDEASDNDGDDDADLDPLLLLCRQRARQAAVDLAEDLRSHEMDLAV